MGLRLWEFIAILSRGSQSQSVLNLQAIKLIGVVNDLVNSDLILFNGKYIVDKKPPEGLILGQSKAIIFHHVFLLKEKALA